MAQQQQQGGGGGGGQGDNSLDFLWLVALTVIAIGLIWYFFHAQITAAIFYVRFYEILVIDYALSFWSSIPLLNHIAAPNTKLLTEWAVYIASRPADVPFGGLVKVSTVVGNYLRYPVIAILALLAWLVFMRSAGNRFRTTYSMERFRKLEFKNWPQIGPILGRDLVKEDIREGPWKMAMDPLEFSKMHNMIEPDRDKSHKPIAKLHKDEAGQVFAAQLGPLWPGIQKVPKYVQALFTIFAARANHDTKGSDKIIKEIAATAVSGKPTFTGYKMLMVKYHNTKVVQRAMARHAYTNTMMATLLELARTDGVLATSQFIWLKPIDRKLWYMLNTVGRETSVSEIAGAHAHWLAERQIGRPLKVPMVDEAVEGLDEALKLIIYEPEED